MTAAGTATAPAGPDAVPDGPPARRRWRDRRWLRAVVPFVVAAAVIAGTVTTHLLEEPDPSRASFLSPVSEAGDGAARLAGLLRQRGVPVTRATTVKEALRAAARERSTLFVPAPSLLTGESVDAALRLPAGSRTVLVAPAAAVLNRARLPVRVTGERWAAAAVPPDCAAPTAVGPAAVLRKRYGPAGAPGVRFSCYRGAVVELTPGTAATVTLVGAADPFRNDRLDEHRNADLAVNLLTGAGRVVWLDVHSPEQPRLGGPAGTPTPDRPAEAPAPTPGDGIGEGQDRDEPVEAPAEDEAQPRPDPLAGLVPPAVWALLFLLAVAAVAIAVASARRLGGPVPEPLPVRVRATETILGRATLYRRARARDAALRVLRETTRHRLAELLQRPPTAGTADLVAAVARHTGRDPERIAELLDDDNPYAAPGDDAALVSATVALHQLVQDVAGRPPRTGEGEPS